jgi:alpha-tubulin suppressor-like RCC1 family protein
MHKAFSHEILDASVPGRAGCPPSTPFTVSLSSPHPSSRHPVVKPHSPSPRRLPLLFLALPLALAGGGCGGGDGTGPTPSLEAASLTIDQPSFLLERGFHQALTATAKDRNGATITIPVVWRSNNEAVATLDANGRVTALDTGIAVITASTLGATAAPIGVRVVWQGAAKIAAFQFTSPGAASPEVTVPDSIRVRVTDLNGNPVPNARVAFSGGTGGGTVSPSTVTTKGNGVAAAEWKLGAAWGPNVVTASVLADDDKPLPFVEANPVTFSITTFPALSAVAGDLQTGQILSNLPVTPSIRVVDAAGKPRAGVPVTFVPTAGGRVASSTVSTGADGVASPGTWTLGDIPGEQSLIVKVESAVLTLRATGTGTPIHFTPTRVTAGGYATCAILADASVRCWGEQPKVGDGTSSPRSTPTPTSGGVKLATLEGSVSHFCGVGTDQAIYCWGTNALADPSGTTIDANVPTRMGSVVAWSQVAPGFAHNCAISADQTTYCWGSNAFGQLGDGTETTVRFAPAPVSGGFKFRTIASGSYHSCGLTLDGAALCWGRNSSSQLGDGFTANRVSPTAVSGTLTFQSIGAGESWTCALTTAGRPYCWGGIPGGTAVQSSPLAYPAAPAFSSLSVGGAHACGLTADGTAYCWGGNTSGQLGDSTTTTRTEPTPVRGGMKFQSISAGYEHTCGRTLGEGAVACWGRNRAGELGDANTTFRLTPRYIVLGVTP